MRKFAYFATIAALAALPAMAQTQSPTQSRTPGQNAAPMPAAPGSSSRTETVSTAEFVQMAGMSDMYEIQASRLAEQQAQAGGVKEYAQHMLRDHTRTSTELQALMQRMDSSASGQLPQNLDQRHMEMVRQLQAARGAAFDRLYVTQQVAAHQQAVDLFRNYSQVGDNAPLKQWASATLPSLRQHLQQAQQLQRMQQAQPQGEPMRGNTTEQGAAGPRG